MHEDEVKEIVIKEIQNLLEITTGIDVEEDLQSIGLDSHISIKLIVQLEELFDFEFTDEDFGDESILTSVASICQFLRGKIIIFP